MAAVLRLRGLPWKCTEQDVVDFFNPLPVGLESVTLLPTKTGRPSGEGYVWIHENNVQAAMTYNKMEIENRFIEIFHSDEKEYTRAVQASALVDTPAAGRAVAAPLRQTLNSLRGGGYKGGAGDFGKGGYRPINLKGGKGKGGGVVGGFGILRQISQPSEPIGRVRGLPFDATPEEVAEAFSEYSVLPEDVFIGVCHCGPRVGDPSGECFIRFADLELMMDAMRVSTQKTIVINNRYLELFPATESEIESQAQLGGLAGYEGNQGTTTGEVEQRMDAAWVRLRGIPFTANTNECHRFLEENGVSGCAVEDIMIKHGSDGRPSGEVYIQLPSEMDDHEAVMKLDKKYMGHRYIEAFTSSYEQSQAVVHNTAGTFGGGFGGGKGGKGKGGFGGPYARRW